MIDEYRSKLYCKDDISKIENYDKAISDNTQTWHCHHKLEIHEDYTNSVNDLKLMNLYYNRPAEELIFLTNSEHRRLHNQHMKGENSPFYGKCHSEETKKKMSDSLSGKNHPLYGKHRSEETKKKISDTQSGKNSPLYGKHLSDETKRKMSETRKGRVPWNKGKKFKIVGD